MTFKQRKIILLLLVILIVSTVGALYNPAKKLLATVRTHSYVYSYFPFNNTKAINITNQKPATAVPILMYHGVRVDGELGPNVTRDNFIKQMEMLKREGYQTISITDYDLFRQGKFVLPPKPVILTFDDGRKDSYYTVDDVLKRLGFKATMFVATVKPNQNDPFYLSWDTLRLMLASGRWDMEAHGRHSHDVVITDAQGTEGRYLTSRIYDPVTKTLESIEDFSTRVRQDYIDGLTDLFVNLGVDSLYYAVPLNDYGEDDSNYTEGIDYNKKLTKDFFKFAFIESLSENLSAETTFYNYKDSNPYTLKRLEVKNRTADELKADLDKYAPRSPYSRYEAEQSAGQLPDDTQVVYGSLVQVPDGLGIKPMSPSSSDAARVLFGDMGWQNYTFTATVIKGTSTEAWVVMYYLDEDNLILLDWHNSGVNITERVDGVDTVLVDKELNIPLGSEKTVLMSVKDGLLDASFDGIQLLSQTHIDIPRGAPGIGVWDPDGNEVKVRGLSVTSLSE